MKSSNILRLVILGVAVLTGSVAAAQVVASAPYTVSVFTTSIPGVDFAPDSIAVLDGHVFVGYGDGAATDGSDGKSSTIVEYKENGDMVRTYTVLGHNDGLRVNPRTKHLANSDADGHAYTNIAIDQGYRAVREVTLGGKHEASGAGA